MMFSHILSKTLLPSAISPFSSIIRQFVIIFKAVFLVSIVVPAKAQEAIQYNYWKEEYKIDYSYSPLSPNGPQSWENLPYSAILNSEWHKYINHPQGHDLFIRSNQCSTSSYSTNSRRSPLNVFPNGPCTDSAEILTRKINPQSDCQPSDMSFEITPHSLRAYFPTNDNVCDRPSILMSNGFPDPFFLYWMELHMRSEHVIEGRRYDAELQMVHMGVDEDDYMGTTVSIMMEASAREDHVQWQWFLDRWQEIKDAYDEDCQEIRKNKGMGTDRKRRAMGDAAETTVGGATTEEKIRQSLRRKVNERRTENENRTALKLSDARLYYGDTNISYDETNKQSYQSTADVQDLFQRVQAESETQSQPEKSTTQNNQQQEQQRRRQQNNQGCVPTPEGKGCEPLGPRRKPFPYNLWPTIYYYRYRGSITYPPCSDIINWRILSKPLKISRRQWKQMASLLNSYKEPGSCMAADDGSQSSSNVFMSPTGENYRPVQELLNENRQQVVACTSQNFLPWMYPPNQQ